MGFQAQSSHHSQAQSSHHFQAQSVDGKTEKIWVKWDQNLSSSSQSVDGKTNAFSQDDESDVSVHDELDVTDQEPSTDVSHISVDSMDVLSHTHSIVKQQMLV